MEPGCEVPENHVKNAISEDRGSSTSSSCSSSSNSSRSSSSDG